MKLKTFKALVELYVAELEQEDNLGKVTPYGADSAKLLLTDFVQWLCDDTEDRLELELNCDTAYMEEDGTMVFYGFMGQELAFLPSVNDATNNATGRSAFATKILELLLSERGINMSLNFGGSKQSEEDANANS